MRKIVYITGTRAEYGVMHSILKAIKDHPKLKLSLVVTGMHLSKRLGYTIDEIKKDGFKIDAIVDAQIKKMDNYEMAQSMGFCIVGITKSLRKLKPDILLLEGDRGETLAGAIVGAHLNIPIVHISGGDISGSIDNSIRKAITNFAHIHLANTPESARRILKIGEQPWRIKMVGALGLDYKLKDLILAKELTSALAFDLKKPIILVVQHSVTGESKCAGPQIKKTLDAILQLKQQTILFYPNADAGSREMIKVIEKYRKYNFIKIFKSLSRREFLGLMAMSDVMVGNSSAGLVEAPMFNLTVVNIGSRQQGRERAKNIIDVGYDTKKIYQTALKILSNRKKYKAKKIKTPYRDANTAKKVIEVLLKLKINPKLLNKYGR